jgi:hypothetical protein
MRVSFDLMLARLHHTISRTPAAAALPSVIGGLGSDFIGSATERESGSR